MSDREIENDLDMDEMMDVAADEPAQASKPVDKGAEPAARSTESAPAKAAAAGASRAKAAPTFMPDKGSSAWDDDDPGETVAAREISDPDPEPADENDDPDAEQDETVAEKGESDDAPKADDKKEADKAAASDPTSWPVYTKLVKQLETKLKNSVTAANYDKEFKKGTDAIKAQLSRYKSPEDFMIAGWNAQQRIRSGELAPKALRKDATPAEAAAWRKANGIPEKADGYNVPKVAGHDWQEHDAPVLNAFKGHFHKAGLSQQQVDVVLSAYAQELQSAYKARDEAFATLDREDQIHMEESLRADPDIGNSEYRPTLTLVKRLLNDREYMPAEAAAKLKKARDAQGHLVMQDPAVVKFMRQIAVDRYGGADSEERRVATVRQLSSRKSEIEKVMREDIQKYWSDQSMQDEYNEILNNEEGLRAGGSRRR